MGREYYPPDDQGMVSGNDILQAGAHTEALLEAKYFHDVAAFREQFFGKLAAHGAMSEDLGWVVFGAEEHEDDDAETLTQREVLLMCYFRPPSLEAAASHPVPLIRIITNEPIISETGFTYLTEDVSVYENGRASYFLGAVRLKDEHGEDVGELAESQSPLFFILENNKLVVTANAGKYTPHSVLQHEVRPDNRVFPYGPATGDSMEDYIYALNSAQAILSSVVHEEPSHANGRIA